MSGFFRILGGGILVLSAFLLSVEYSSYAKRRVDHYLSLASLFSHAGGVISRFLLSGSEMWRDFHSEELERVGLLPCLREGTSLSEAFKKCESRLLLSKDIKEKIGKILSSKEREYKDGVVEAYFSLAKELECEGKGEKERIEKSVKVTRALLIGGTLAFLILII
jgi:hypothetical protein